MFFIFKSKWQSEKDKGWEQVWTWFIKLGIGKPGFTNWSENILEQGINSVHKPNLDCHLKMVFTFSNG